MATFTYAAALALIRVMERAGIDDEWNDFCRAYKIRDPGVDPPRDGRPRAGYSGPPGATRMSRLRAIASQSETNESVRRFLEQLTQAVLHDVYKPARFVLGTRDMFLIDPEVSLGEVDNLVTELIRGGYLVEDDGQLTSDDTSPADPDIDEVTGIASRRYLREQSSRLLDECAAGNVPCAAIFCDIDRFKQFNDEHGHDVGDQVLRDVAQTIQACITGRGGVVGKYGGEEIVATMRNMDESEAAALGERIRGEVARRGVRNLAVTISVGVASQMGGTLDALWRMADTAVLRAKAQGRNRVVRYSECPPES